jgi:hypothetical protein
MCFAATPFAITEPFIAGNTGGVPEPSALWQAAQLSFISNLSQDSRDAVNGADAGRENADNYLLNVGQKILFCERNV